MKKYFFPILQKKYLRSLVRGTRIDRVGIEVVRRRDGKDKDSTSKVDQVLRWFGYMERMDEQVMAKSVLMSKAKMDYV